MASDILLSLRLTQKQWETLRDGWADVACWHMGYREAKPDYEGPPQLREVGEVIADLKAQVLDGSS